jgi:glycosyltransferase involved in cell wall biosynthesis
VTRSVRVAVVVDSDAFGGAEVWTYRVLEHLSAGIRPNLVVTEPVADRLGVPQRVERRIVVPLARHCEAAPEVAAALAEIVPDVVHVNLVDPASNRAVLDAALSQAPTVAALHLPGAAPDAAGLRRRYVRLAGAVAPSAPIAAQLVALGVPAHRVTRVRHGVPLPAVPVRPPGRAPLVIGGVGRLTAQKGFDLLLAAVARLHKSGRPLRVVIAGEGRDAAALRRQAAGLPVRFLGFCPDVPALLRRLDVFCLPSRSEALSLALLEAVAHGLPCVTTAVGDTAAALTGAARIVPPEDLDALTAALDDLLVDAGRRRDLGDRARQRALRDFRVERMAAEVAAVWATVAQATAHGSAGGSARGSAGGEDGVDRGEHVGDR